MLSGSREEVSWLCHVHGPYRMALQLRAHDGQGCRVCAREAAEAKRRETLRTRRLRMQSLGLSLLAMGHVVQSASAAMWR